MSTDWLIVVHCCYEPDEKPAADTVLDWLFDYGCYSGPDGGRDTCRYFGKESATAGDYAPVEDALEQLIAGHAHIKLQLDELEFRYQNWEDLDGVPELPYYSFQIREADFAPMPTEEAARARVRTFVDMIATFADETGVFYGFGTQGAGEFQSHRQDADKLLAGEFQKLFWFNYFSETLVDGVGRERVLSTPAHRIEERTDGAVLLVLSPNPHPRVNQNGGPTDMQAERHLDL